MIIELKKFGTTLTSRQAGKEALAAFRPVLRNLSDKELIEIDFTGVITFTPSWADEFITPLAQEYGDLFSLRDSDNPSVKETLKLLRDISESE